MNTTNSSAVSGSDKKTDNKLRVSSDAGLKKSDVLKKLAETENMHTDARTGQSDKKQVGKLAKIGIPILAISVCLCITLFILNSAISNMDTIRGRFIISGENLKSYIDFNASGTYEMSDDGENISKKGNWEYSGGSVILSPYGDMESCVCTFADRKYFAVRDNDFLKGNIPDDANFDAEVTDENGRTYGFNKEGTFYSVQDGRHTELGTYIVDGSFITVNTNGEIHTFLKCGDGITEKYYVHS